MSDGSVRDPAPTLFKTTLRSCLFYGLLVSLALSLSITYLNSPLRTLPDLLVVLLYLSLVYGAASLALGAGIAAALRLMWPGRGKPWTQDDVSSLATGGFFGFCVFFYLGSWWRYQVAVVDGSSLFSILSLAKLVLLGLVAIFVGWLVFHLHRRLKGRFTRYRWAFLLALLAVLGLWLVMSGYALGRVPREDKQPGSSVRVDLTGTKVLLFALDGATWKTLDPLIRSGKLPALSRLVDAGASGPLTTFQPTESPLIWTSIATGMTPQKHGIRDYVVTRIPGLNTSYLFGLVQASYPRFTGVRLVINLFRKLGLIETLPVTSGMRRAKALWNILGDAGFTVGVNSWWATWPAEEVNGYLVSEYISMSPEPHALSLQTTSRGLTYPETLYADLEPLLEGQGEEMEKAEVDRFMRLEDSEIEALNGPYRTDDPLSNFKWVYDRDTITWSTEKALMQRFQPSFSTLYLRGIDVISHLYWQYVEPERFEGIDPADQARFGKLLENYTVLLDSVIEDFLELIDEDTVVFVVSDHGVEATGELPLSGNHYDAPDGIIVVSGKNIRPTSLENVSVFDIVPTVLHLMGLPVSREMEGRVVTEMMDPEFLSAHPVREIDTYGPNRRTHSEPVAHESREEIEKQLKALGYLD
jgi:predicted AlkP superfamily phosphohydrolase/phosphomutase